MKLLPHFHLDLWLLITMKQFFLSVALFYLMQPEDIQSTKEIIGKKINNVVKSIYFKCQGLTFLFFASNEFKKKT